MKKSAAFLSTAEIAWMAKGRPGTPRMIGSKSALTFPAIFALDWKQGKQLGQKDEGCGCGACLIPKSGNGERLKKSGRLMPGPVKEKQMQQNDKPPGVAQAEAQLGVVRSTVRIVFKAIGVLLATFFFVEMFMNLLGVEEGGIRKFYVGLLTCVISLPALYGITLRPLTRLAAEHATASAESRFWAVAQSAQDGIVIFDTNKSILFANKAAERMYGYEAGSLRGKLLEILLPEDRREELRESVATYLRTKQSLVIGKGPTERAGLRTSGERFPVEISVSELRANKETQFVVVMRDISARKQAEMAVLEAERTLRKILDTIPLGVRIIQNGVVVYANSTDAELHGFSDASEEMGMDSLLSIASEETDRLLEYAKRRAAGEDAPRRYEARRRRRDATEFQAEMYAELILFHGAPASLLVIDDLAERQRLRMYEQLLPVCCVCGKIRDDHGVAAGTGAWDRLDHYISKHTDAKLTHTFCPECLVQYRKEQGIE
jgi:PAS domain S-box-containing protein